MTDPAVSKARDILHRLSADPDARRLAEEAAAPAAGGLHTLLTGAPVRSVWVVSDARLHRAWVLLLHRDRETRAVFSTLGRATAAVPREHASGLLTEFPIDVGAWNFAVAIGGFRVKKPHQREADFIADFTSPLDHLHLEEGHHWDAVSRDAMVAPASPDTTWWIFSGGARPAWASGVFTTPEKATSWIAQHGLDGWLTEYAVDPSAFSVVPGEADRSALRRLRFVNGAPAEAVSDGKET